MKIPQGRVRCWSTVALLLACGAGVAGTPAAAASVVVASVAVAQGAAPAAQGAAPAPPKRLVMLYRKAADTAPDRLDPTVQAVTLALEHEFLNRQYLITQPSAEVYRTMDQSPGVIVTFAPDAGMSLVYSVNASMRPTPGTEIAIAEVRIDARVFVGSTLLSAEQGRGQIQTRTDPALQKYGESRGYEIAAQRAAMDVANRVHMRLSGLSAEDIAGMTSADKSAAANFTVVAPPGAPPGADTATPPPPPPAPRPSGSARRWLLTIGVSDYSKATGFPGAGSHLNDLPGTPVDVRNVQRTLKGFGFDDSSTIQLFDRSATTAAVRAALTRLTASAGPDDLVVLYISSHGLEKNFGQAGVTIPVFFDTDVSADPYALLDYGDLVKLFAQIPARQLIMIIDACYSGGATMLMTTVAVSSQSVALTHSGGSPDLSRVMSAAKGARSDIAVMSGARTDETALDLGPTVGGLFTSQLMSALLATHGAAPLEEIYRNYVWTPVIDYCRKNPAGSPPCQHPVMGYGGAGNMIRIAAPGP